MEWDQTRWILNLKNRLMRLRGNLKWKKLVMQIWLLIDTNLYNTWRKMNTEPLWQRHPCVWSITTQTLTRIRLSQVSAPLLRRQSSKLCNTTYRITTATTTCRTRCLWRNSNKTDQGMSLLSLVLCHVTSVFKTSQDPSEHSFWVIKSVESCNQYEWWGSKSHLRQDKWLRKE